MKTKRLIIVLLAMLSLLTSVTLNAQQSGSLKNTFSAIHIVEDDLPTYTDSYASKLELNKFPENVYRYDLNSTVIKVPPRPEEMDPLAYINQVVQDQKIGNEILENDVFHIQNGSFNMKPLYERIQSEAADIFAVLANSQGREPSTDQERAYFNRVIDTRFLLVFHHHGLVKYNLDDPDGFRKGFAINQDVYMFKVDFGKEVINYEFWDKGYVSESDDAEKITSASSFRKNMDIPLQQVSLTESSMASLNYEKSFWADESKGVKAMAASFANPTEQYNETKYFDFLLVPEHGDNPMKGDANKFIFNFPGVQLARGIYDVKPVQVRVGKAQGVKLNRRYDVYKYKERRSGKISQVRIGIIKAFDVSSGVKGEDGMVPVSTFKQVYGRKLDLGDEIRGNKLITSIYGGYTTKGIAARAEFNGFGYNQKFFVDMLGDNSLPDNLPSEIAVGGSNESTDVTVFSLGVGYGREFVLAKLLTVSPYIAGRYYDASFRSEVEETLIAESEREDYGKDLAMEAGVRVGIRFHYNLSAMITAGYNTVAFDRADNAVFHPEDGTYALSEYQNSSFIEFALRFDITQYLFKTNR